MDFFEAVDARYSYRGEYTDDPVSRDDLEKIIRAGLAAPSIITVRLLRSLPACP